MFLPDQWPNYYKKAKDVKFGILKIKNTMILLEWELQPALWDMPIRK